MDASLQLLQVHKCTFVDLQLNYPFVPLYTKCFKVYIQILHKRIETNIFTKENMAINKPQV